MSDASPSERTDERAPSGENLPPNRPVLLFDGVCNLCTGIVQFVLDRDPDGQFLFASLQSEAGQGLLERFGLPTGEFDSFVMVVDEAYYTKSDAALRVARRLGLPWSLLWPFRHLPRPLRDGVYDVVARYRYRVFGKKDRCMVPTPERRERFLDW